MTHPLTKEIMYNIQMYNIHRNHAGYSDPFSEDDMRAAADWQLQKVIEWLRSNLVSGGYIDISYIDIDNFHDYSIDIDDIVHDLKNDLRPQHQQKKDNDD
jgi:hypothetical protein